MDNQQLTFSNTVQHLGITLDYKLNWKPHIQEKNQIMQKCVLLINSNLKGMQVPKPKLSNGHTQESYDQKLYMAA